LPWIEPVLPWDGQAVTTPYRGSSLNAEATSKAGAIKGWPRAGSQAWTIFLLIRERPRTMNELRDLTSLPINVICARVGWLRKQRLVKDSKRTRLGPSGVLNVIWEAT
jgi:hypothetical protein